MIEIKDLVGLSKPLTRLIEVISAGIGAVSRPYLAKKDSEAKAHEIRVISAALKEVAEQHRLPVIYKEGVIEVWQKPEDRTLALDALPPEERTALRLDYQERKRQQNIEGITSVAAAELSQIDDISGEKPDEDWITRFFSSAQDISSEQMQDLWGRVLAGEIKKPGSYSLKTLEFMRNVTKSDAAALEHVGKISLQYGATTFIATHDQNWLQEHLKIYPGHHFSVSEMGAMYPTDLNLRLFREDSTQEEVFVAGDLMLLVSRGENKSEIQLPMWKFTMVGRELLALIPKANDETYLESLGLFFVEKKANARIARVIEKLPDGRIRYNDIRTIDKPSTLDDAKTEA